MVTPATPDDLAAAYGACRSINRRHATSFHIATRLLDASQRPHVHALYAFARVADDIVDVPVAEPAEALAGFRRRFLDAVESGHSDDLVLAATVDTISECAIPLEPFDRFFRSMEMDLHIRSYPTWVALLGYMDGSAAAIGDMMLPILRPSDSAAASPPARELGLAFQLTNFLPDVGEDLDRRRTYIPGDDLERFGVDLESRSVTPGFVEMMRYEIDRCRSLYRAADVGIDLLPARSARGIRTASALYEAILAEIEGIGFDVFAHRARVSPRRRAAIVARSMSGRRTARSQL